MSNPDKEPNYSVLARIYDTLMDDVNYEAWADYIDEVIQEHCPEAEDILELACGTGTLALLLDELGVYTITATDGSPFMIEKAKQKVGPEHSEITFKAMDFLEMDLESTFDVAFMVFDSLNYLHNETDILKLHAEVASILRPGGIFIYDFTTPRNSRKAISYLHNEEGISPDHYRYFRTSDYNAQKRLHTNSFTIEKLNERHSEIEEQFVEIHQQKIYTLKQIQAVVKQTEFRLLAAYEGFQLQPADEQSLRITMVLQWKNKQSSH